MSASSETEKKLLRNILVAVWTICFLIILGTISVMQTIQGRFSGDSKSPKVETEVVEQIVDGKDKETGLIAAPGYLTVKQNCTNCHSSKLITQNHLSRDRWEQTIRWMQKNQNLGQLGDNEVVILDYLAANYGPQNSGRRKPLDPPVWYPLK